jgi:hypothetical protein
VTRACAALAVLLAGCGAPPEACPPGPEHVVGGTYQCVIDECGLGSLAWSSFGCEAQLSPWHELDSCDWGADYRCMMGRRASVRYSEDRAFFSIEGPDGCVTSYVLSAEPVECTTGAE